MKLWGLLIGAAAIAACGSADDTKDVFGSKVCIPGATQECACPGGVKGAQACRDDGSGYATCQCGGSGSGGSAGAGGDAGVSGGGSGGTTGGAGGSCTPRSMCPAPDPSGTVAPLCGMLDDYCGGKLSCGCDFGDCIGSVCSCWRIPSYDGTCRGFGAPPVAIQCASGAAKPDTCKNGPPNNFPANAYCCN